MSAFKLLPITLLCLMLQVFSGFAQDDPESIQDSIVTNADIFAMEGPAEITLKYDMKEFRKKGRKDKYIQAELTYHLGDTLPDVVHTVRIKARGKNRQDVCAFPPIWVNIKKADIRNLKLKDTKKIKLVTHCGNSPAFETYVLKEYMAYKIYNLITPYSFRVRLVKMKYIDTSKKDKLIERWGFLIEPEDMLAERFDMVPFKNDYVSITQTDTTLTDYMTIFQFMIGNSDYSVAGRHNVKLIKHLDYKKPEVYPVPYDFDYCGLVDAHYAVPGDKLGLESVQQRYYLGACRTLDHYSGVIAEFEQMRDGIYELIMDFNQLPEKERERMTGYLEEFFSSAGQDWYIQRKIMSTCR